MTKAPYIYDTHDACARYRVYDIATDEYIYSTRYASMGRIKLIGGEETGPRVMIERKYLDHGWTKKGFDPDNPA